MTILLIHKPMSKKKNCELCNRVVPLSTAFLVIHIYLRVTFLLKKSPTFSSKITTNNNLPWYFHHSHMTATQSQKTHCSPTLEDLFGCSNSSLFFYLISSKLQSQINIKNQVFRTISFSLETELLSLIPH